jgi:hypothetical protein
VGEGETARPIQLPDRFFNCGLSVSTKIDERLAGLRPWAARRKQKIGVLALRAVLISGKLTEAGVE